MFLSILFSVEGRGAEKYGMLVAEEQESAVLQEGLMERGRTGEPTV